MFKNVSFLSCVISLGMLLPGCSSEPVVTKTKADNLEKIGQAYRDATMKLGRPPRNAGELRPFLAGIEDVESLFRSPNDGEPYVIIWGADPNTPPPSMDSVVVIAYEKKGSRGKRVCFTGMTGIRELTDEEFKKATFPNGHRPLEDGT